MPLILPEGYRNVLENVENTEKAIKYVKDMFQENLSAHPGELVSPAGVAEGDRTYDGALRDRYKR